MGQVSQFKRQAYSGAVADNAAITPNDGDTFYATDTEQLFIGHGGSWVHWPRQVHIPRNTPHFDKTAFTCDGALHVDGLDLTGIVPVGTVKIRVKLSISDDAANSTVVFWKDQVDTEDIVSVLTFVANISNTQIQCMAINPDRLLDYTCSNLVFTAINVTLLDYWI